MHLNLTLHEANDYMQGNYSHNIADFDQAKSVALTIADKISAAVTAATTTTTTTTSSTNTTTTTTNTTTTSTNTTSTTTNTTSMTTNTTTTTTNTTNTTTNVTTTIMVTIVSRAGSNTSSLGYSPNNISIVLGVNNTVTWTNDDSVDHTVTSTDVPPNATSFDSGLIAPGATFNMTFTVPGTYHYLCTFHPWMSGTIVVKGY